MSGLLALVAPNRAPIDRGVAGRVLHHLDHRGPDGCDLVVEGALAVGHQHHWTTPEEVGERQPVTGRDRRLLLGFDGRLDNRAELAAALGLDGASLATASDAGLALYAFERWGEEGFARLLGPFAVVIADLSAQVLICARDPLGDRSLFYGGDHGLLVVASEEQAVLAHPRLGDEFDEASLAALLAVRARPSGRSYFREVRELPQGHLLRIRGGRLELRRYWQWQPRVVRLRDDREYAEAFREGLTRAVQCRLRTSGRAGVLMSGGLDSTSVACVAASELGACHRLATVSWVFDELSSCDERQYMDPVVAAWRAAPIRVSGDDGWPLRDARAWPYNPNRPADNAYRLLKDRAYAAAREHGLGVLLTGGWGDHLYTGGAHWLTEQLGASRWQSAATELAWHARHGSLLREPGVRRLGARLLGRRGAGAPAAPPPWLTARAIGLLEAGPQVAPELAGWPRPDQAAIVCGPLAADSAAAETFHAGRHGIELRHPYRDRRLVELMLGVPADQLARRGLNKHLLRAAMAGLLPDVVRLRPRPTSLVPLYQRGLLDRERGTLDRLLNHPDAVWRRFVHEDALRAALAGSVAEGRDGPEGLVPWFGAYLELWGELAVRSRDQSIAAA